MVISLYFFYHGYRDTESKEQEALHNMYSEAHTQDYHCDHNIALGLFYGLMNVHLRMKCQ